MSCNLADYLWVNSDPFFFFFFVLLSNSLCIFQGHYSCTMFSKWYYVCCFVILIGPTWTLNFQYCFHLFSVNFVLSFLPNLFLNFFIAILRIQFRWSFYLFIFFLNIVYGIRIIMFSNSQFMKFDSYFQNILFRLS